MHTNFVLVLFERFEYNVPFLQLIIRNIYQTIKVNQLLFVFMNKDGVGPH